MRVRMRPYVAVVARATRIKVAVALCLMVLYSLTEGIGIALLLPTLQAVGLDLAHQGDAGRYANAIASAVAAIGLPPTLPVAARDDSWCW